VPITLLKGFYDKVPVLRILRVKITLDSVWQFKFTPAYTHRHRLGSLLARLLEHEGSIPASDSNSGGSVL